MFALNSRPMFWIWLPVPFQFSWIVGGRGGVEFDFNLNAESNHPSMIKLLRFSWNFTVTCGGSSLHIRFYWKSTVIRWWWNQWCTILILKWFHYWLESESEKVRSPGIGIRKFLLESDSELESESESEKLKRCTWHTTWNPQSTYFVRDHFSPWPVVIQG